MNTTILHQNKIKKVDQEFQEQGCTGFQVFANCYLGRNRFTMDISHGPYQLKRIQYNSTVIPKKSEMTPEEQTGQKFAEENLKEISVQVSADSRSWISPYIEPYTEFNLINYYKAVSGEGKKFWVQLWVLRMVVFLLAVTLGIFTLEFFSWLNDTDLIPLMSRDIPVIGEDIPVLELIGATTGIFLAFHASRGLYRRIQRPLEATFECDFSRRVHLPDHIKEHIAFEEAIKSGNAHETLGDYFRQTFVFKRQKLTPAMQADRVVLFKEPFRIGGFHRQSRLLQYKGTRKNTWGDWLARKKDLGWFRDNFFDLDLQELGDNDFLNIKQNIYFDLGKITIKLNFPILRLETHTIEGQKIGDLHFPTNDQKYVIRGSITKNKELHQEIKAKEQLCYVRSSAKKVDEFQVIFSAQTEQWEINF
ncbi:MAG: hypothetical protein ACFFCQ_00450 [Promethearchaeota archaeon]